MVNFLLNVIEYMMRKDPPFVINVTVRIVVLFAKVIIKVLSLVIIGDACQPYQICPAQGSDSAWGQAPKRWYKYA